MKALCPHPQTCSIRELGLVLLYFRLSLFKLLLTLSRSSYIQLRFLYLEQVKHIGQHVSKFKART
jgi:hypothetical protein